MTGRTMKEMTGSTMKEMTGRPMKWIPPAAAAITLALLIALSCSATVAHSAAPPTYTFDQDPIRLGGKALEDGRLADAAARFHDAIAAGYQVPRATFGLGEVAARSGRYTEAESLYAGALQERAREKPGEDYPEARAALGLILLRAGRDQEAAAHFQLALASNPRLWDALYGQARLALKSEKWDDARKLLDQGRKLKGAAQGEDKYHYGAALYEMGHGNADAAETEALLAVSLNPADPDYGTLLAAIYRRKGVPALAIDAYERAFASLTAASPGAAPPASALTELGHLYQEVGRYNDARDAYLKAIAADSTFAPALNDLGALYRLAGQPDRAAMAYRKALDIHPADLDALVGFAESARESRQFDQALGAATRAMAIDSARLDVRLTWARAALAARDGETRAKAAALLQSLPDSVRMRPEDRVQLAAAEIEMKQFAEAERNLDRALRANPRLAEAWFQRGMLDLNTARNDSAVAHLNEAIRLDPAAGVYRLNLGVALLRADRPRDAIPVLRQGLELDPQFSSARVLLAQSLVMADSLPQAEREYRRVVEADAGNGPAWRGLGYCLIRKANYREAVRAYKSATAAEPENADAWAGLGNAQLGLKDWDAAQAAFNRARAIDPGNVTLKRGQEILNRARKGDAVD